MSREPLQDPNRIRKATPDVDNILKLTWLTLRIVFIAISPNATTKYIGDIGLLLRKKRGILKL
jgi:hypothetical protein